MSERERTEAQRLKRELGLVVLSAGGDVLVTMAMQRQANTDDLTLVAEALPEGTRYRATMEPRTLTTARELLVRIAQLSPADTTVRIEVTLPDGSTEVLEYPEPAEPAAPEGTTR